MYGKFISSELLQYVVCRAVSLNLFGFAIRVLFGNCKLICREKSKMNAEVIDVDCNLINHQTCKGDKFLLCLLCLSPEGGQTLYNLCGFLTAGEDC